MTAPNDAYPHATRDGRQIRLDTVRILQLDHQIFNATTGVALDTAPYADDANYVLWATEACIVRFDDVATQTPVTHKAILLDAGERATIMLPAGSTGFSSIGLVLAGTLFIQRIEVWAGLADDNTLGNN